MSYDPRESTSLKFDLTVKRLTIAKKELKEITEKEKLPDNSPITFLYQETEESTKKRL